MTLAEIRNVTVVVPELVNLTATHSETVIMAVGAVWQLARGMRSTRGVRDTMYAGLENVLPLILILSFVLLPSQAMRILKVFLCDPFRFDDVAGNASLVKRCECLQVLTLLADITMQGPTEWSTQLDRSARGLWNVM